MTSYLGSESGNTAILIMPESSPEVISERVWFKLIGEEVLMSHVWPLLSCKVCLVRELLDESERMACMVVMESDVGHVTEAVTKGLPLTRKKLRFEEGMSKVTLRSLKEEMTCLACKPGVVLVSVEEMVMSGLKSCAMKEELKLREG